MSRESDSGITASLIPYNTLHYLKLEITHDFLGNQKYLCCVTPTCVRLHKYSILIRITQDWGPCTLKDVTDQGARQHAEGDIAI